MGFLDEVSKKASDVYKGAADKTNKLARESKLKSKINQNKTAISGLYSDIGKKVYEKHVKQENVDINVDLAEECKKIDELSAEIEECSNEILECRNKKKCPNCATELERDAKFCHVCGAKQEELPEPEEKIPEGKKKCPKCQSIIDIDTKFCSICGAKQEMPEDLNNAANQAKEETAEQNPITEDSNNQ